MYIILQYLPHIEIKSIDCVNYPPIHFVFFLNLNVILNTPLNRKDLKPLTFDLGTRDNCIF